MSHLSGAIGELCLFGKIRKNVEGKVVANHVSDLRWWNVLPRMSCSGATFFTSSIVKSYGEVATLTWQRKEGIFKE
jgi:hypothetical protein